MAGIIAESTELSRADVFDFLAGAGLSKRNRERSKSVIDSENETTYAALSMDAFLFCVLSSLSNSLCSSTSDRPRRTTVVLTFWAEKSVNQCVKNDQYK